MRPLVSIAMPVFNCAATVGSSIRSILAQTYENWELLILDDGSTDSTLKVISSFADSRIVVTSDGANKTLAPRLNECIDAARGQYLARMDSDDIAYPRRLEKQVQFLETHPDIDLVSAFVLVFGVNGVPIGKRSGPVCHEDIVRRPLRGFPMVHPTWAGKLSWFRAYRYRGEAVRCEDQDLLLRSFSESRFAVLPEILLGYREERLEVRKILRGRMNWVRSVGRVSGSGGRLQQALVAIDQASKGCVDYVAVLTGLNHYLLRHRARPADAAEIQEWEEVWMQVADRPLTKTT